MDEIVAKLTDTPQDIEKKILNDETNILHANLIVSIPANFLCYAIVFIDLYLTNPFPIYQAWFYAGIIISILRLTGFYFYNRVTKDRTYFLPYFQFGVILSAMLWGICGFYFMAMNGHLQQMLIIIVIAGVTAGGIQTLQANIFSCLSYVAISLVPLCIYLFLESGLTNTLLGIVITTYFLFLIATSLRGHRLLENTLCLKYEKIALVENLSDVNQRLQEAFNDLKQREVEETIINNLNHMLQMCITSDEAYPVIISTAKEFFKGYSGGLSIYDPIKNKLKIVSEWGNNQLIKKEFPTDDCFCVRLGAEYIVNDPSNEVPCHHYTSTPTNACMDMPLVIQKDLIGVFHLIAPKGKKITEHEQEFSLIFNNVIKLALSNIRLRENLREESVNDPLTGLYNRRYLTQISPHELQSSLGENGALSVCMIDIDHFKKFNDDYGHEAGDLVLIHLANLLKNRFRGNDIASRFGGEEFIVILMNTELETAVKRMEQIRNEIKKVRLTFHGKELPMITTSIGIANSPQHGSTFEALISRADEALYKAKNNGRDRIEVYKKEEVLG